MADLRFDNSGKKTVVGFGSALIDILTHEDDQFLAKTGAVKGGMIYVDRQFIEQTLTLCTGRPVMVPGGSACNTVVGIGRLGGAARFVGKCGSGKMGDFIQEDLLKQNVEPALLRSSAPTGRVLSIVTPDAQRTMLTYLGAASEIRPEEITAGHFKGAAIVHIEGYLLFNPDLIIKIFTAARESGAAVSLDLASFTVVEQSRNLLADHVRDFVDILIANEEEARAYTGLADELRALEAMGRDAEIAVLKIGARGSYIARRGQVVPIASCGAGPVVDTTGAGDLWAAGFLYGLVAGYGLEACGRLASACGYEVCRVMGANIPDEGWQRIKNLQEGQWQRKKR